MSKETDYRTSAAQTLQLAERATTLADKGSLVLLAGRWLEMADRAHRLALMGAYRPHLQSPSSFREFGQRRQRSGRELARDRRL
jgi:hypothetical protein